MHISTTAPIATGGDSPSQLHATVHARYMLAASASLFGWPAEYVSTIINITTIIITIKIIVIVIVIIIIIVIITTTIIIIIISCTSRLQQQTEALLTALDIAISIRKVPIPAGRDHRG